jgi:DNA-binding MarR family transcriptional regulator
MYDEALQSSGLRAMQFFILMTIRGHGEASVTELTGYLKMDQTTVTRSLQILERQGWIEPVTKKDRRRRTVRVTAEGLAVLEVAEPLWAAVQETALGALGREDWARTKPVLARVLAVAEGPGGGGPVDEGRDQ